MAERIPGSPHDRVYSRKGGSEYVDQSQTRGRNKAITVGPHIAIVKNNIDDMRRGSLSVYVPEFGGDPEWTDNWISVRYASPFISHTVYKTAKNNEYDEIRHTSGIWVQTPDLDSKVIVSFLSGDKNQGVWFACVPERFNTRMVPGLASADTNWDAKSDNKGPNGTPEFKQADGTYDQYQPVGEFHDPKRPKTNEYYDTPVDIEGQEKPINYHLARIFKEQGLNVDLIRGHTSSSAQRETPSDVFGISTKGRPVPDPKDDVSLLNKLSANSAEDLTKEELEKLNVKKRKHGHSFVMDDGDIEGENNLIRLRSASGHQVLLHDTKGVVYVGNAKGTVWMEFSNDGKLDVYAQDSINYRAKNFNFHADQNMNFNAGENINILSGGKFQVDGASINLKSTGGSIGLDSNRAFDIKSSGIINLDAGGQINIKGGSDVKIDGSCVALGNGAGSASSVSALVKLDKADTTKDTAGFWKSNDKKIKTISTRVPTHEPFASRDIKDDTKTIIKQETNTKQPLIIDDIPPEQSTVLGLGPQQASSKPIARNERLSRASLKLQPTPNGEVGNLSQDETKKLLAIIGQRESSGNYQAVNQYGYLGKYQMGLAALEDAGYVKPGTYQQALDAGYGSSNINNVLQNPNVWTGKNGATGKEAFLNNTAAQEAAMETYTDRNYATLKRIGVVNDNTPSDEVAGYIMGAHLKGPGSVKKWAIEGGTYADANGTTIDSYYNLGRSAVLTA